MGRVKKELDRNAPFPRRFNDLCNRNYSSQAALAKALGVSRPTVYGWLTGKSIPDILALEKIAQHFGVSADYLLGLSDTESPDVSVQAAVEYTGLSEAAVEKLHIGLSDFECDGEGISDEEKKRILGIASALIQSEAFEDIVYRLGRVSEEAYWEKLFSILEEKYFGDGSVIGNDTFEFARSEDRDIIKNHLLCVLKERAPWMDEGEIHALDDDGIASQVITLKWNIQNQSELHQFHAAKAFTGYIDQVMTHSHKKARARFEPK